jgi:transposase
MYWGPVMRKEGTASPKDWREARRLRAWELKQKGWKQTDIAEALGVSDGAVSQWLKIARKHGVKALRSQHGGGPKQRITDEQLHELPDLLALGPEHYGYEQDAWTCETIAEVIHREFGVRYTSVHVGRLLRQIGWS